MITTRSHLLSSIQIQLLNRLITGSSYRCSKPLLDSVINAPLYAFHNAHSAGECDTVKLAACLSTAIMKSRPFETGNKRTALLAAGLQCAIGGRGMLVDKEGMLEWAHRKVVEGKITEERLEEIYREMLDREESEKEEILSGMITQE
ncbi:hypothetical protein BZA77DRAFT_278527 [Pyronema omphalodes]|nr:hypothetical protein BZA77DRAFT_278527 [Pyronema omphalodes]